MSKYPPECPFCGRAVARPEATKTEFGEVLSGACACGAVYVCDPTGHNTGEAYVEALALAKGAWDIGSLNDESDYRTDDIDYDLKTHQRIYTKGQSTLSGRLIFVKMEGPAAAAAPAAASAPAPVSAAVSERRSGLKMKQTVRKLLDTSSLDEIVALAAEDKGVLRWLIASAYDKEEVTSWRAIEAMGLISRQLSKTRAEVMRDTVRKLLWSMGEESGGIGWSAAEMLGEIVAGNPDSFTDIVPIIWSFKDELMFRAGVVWAMGKIAQVRPDLVRFVEPELPALLADENPAVRGYAVWVCGLLGCGSGHLARLLDDRSTLPFYEGRALPVKTVGELAAAALHKPV
ncbi:MAG: DVU0298 family protein [Nitrospirota bacterium]